MDDVRHVCCRILQVLGVFAGKKLIHSCGKDRQPAVKLRASHRSERDETFVGSEWIAHKATAAEKHRFPEGIHLRQMHSPVSFRYIVEDKSKQVVASDFFVERVHKTLNVSTPGNIRLCGSVHCSNRQQTVQVSSAGME